MMKIVGSCIQTEINPEDYVIMHKAELESIMVNSDILKWGAELGDKAGTFILGFATSLYFTPEHPMREIMIYFALGGLATAFGIYHKRNRNSLIDKVLKRKLIDT